ncbi:MAG: hypothetical protein AAF585_18845, partial [Verrucomicrobiota bacterium]
MNWKAGFLQLSAWIPACLGAAIISDPEPTMNWEELRDSELVFVAVYKSHQGEPDFDYDRGHQGQTAKLEIVRSLKGELADGDTLTLPLENWYNLQTKQVGSWFMRDDAKDDGIPRLCYMHQPINPGGLTPNVIIPDLREPHLFFVRNASDPKLRQLGQVRTLRLEAGWNSLVNGQEPSQEFLIIQQVNHTIHLEALQRLERKRDPMLLDQLFASIPWLSDQPGAWGFGPSYQAFEKIGDVDGDVYNRALVELAKYLQVSPYSRFLGNESDPDIRVKAIEERNAQQAAESLTIILAQANSKRAVEDAQRWLDSESATQRHWAAKILGSAMTRDAMRYALDLCQEPETAAYGLSAVKNLMSDGGVIQIGYSRPSKIFRAKFGEELQQLQRMEAAEIVQQDYLPKPENLLRDLRRIPLQAQTPTILTDAQITADLKKLEPALKAANAKGGDSSFDDRKPIESILTRWTESGDFRVVPHLAELAKRFPDDAQVADDLCDALSVFAGFNPVLVRNEVERVGLTHEFLESKDAGRIFPNSLFKRIGRPRGDSTLKNWFEEEFREERAILATKSPELLETLENDIAKLLRGDRFHGDYERVGILWHLDRQRGDEVFDELLADRHNLSIRSMRELYVVAMQCGRGDELIGEFLNALRFTEKERRSYADSRARGECDYWSREKLLEADHPKALNEYLRLLDEDLERGSAPYRKHYGRFVFASNYMRASPQRELQDLFPRYPKEFLDRVIKLVESESFGDRSAGVAALESKIWWVGGLSGNDIGRKRAQRLAIVIPELEKMREMNELEIRAHVLQLLGYGFDGEPGQAWIDEVTRAAGSFDWDEWRGAARLAEL